MEGKPIVSVVIPVYNTKEYLPTCLHSILNQTIGAENLEIIIVDDGSTDGSREYLKEFAGQNINVKLFCLPENTGDLGYVRNIGIKAAAGEWLYCVDSDDWLGAEALERLVKHAAEWGSDVIQGKMMNVDGPKKKGRFDYFNGDEASLTFGNLAFDEIVSATVGPMRLIKMDLLKDNSILFPEGVWPEDIIFMLEVLFAATHISIANDYEYYFVRRDSYRTGGLSNVSNITSVKKPDRILKAMEKVFDIIEENSVEPLEYLLIIKKIFSYQLGHVIEQIDAFAKQFPELCSNQGKEYKNQIWKRARKYYTAELRNILAIDKAVRWDFANQGIYDNSDVRILRFCKPKPLNTVKLLLGTFGSCKKTCRLPELRILAGDTWARLYKTAVEAAVFCVTSVNYEVNYGLIIKGTYEFPLLVTTEQSFCPILQYENTFLFAKTTTIINDVWGESYQGRGRWEAVYRNEELKIRGIKKAVTGVCFYYDEKQTAVINTFRNESFAERSLSIIQSEARDTGIEFILDVGAKSTETQLTKAKEKIKKLKNDCKMAKEDLRKAEKNWRRTQKELETLKKSNSWKLTEPFRQAAGVIRRVLK